MKPHSKYPDVSDILQRKTEGRKDLAGRSFGDKLDALDTLRDRAVGMREARMIAMPRTDVKNPV